VSWYQFSCLKGLQTKIENGESSSTKGEAPISKRQIPNNIQTPISNDLNENNLNFVHWNLFAIWNLELIWNL